MNKFFYTTLFLFFLHHSFAQYNITTIGVPVVENFTGFGGNGFTASPGAGQLDSDNWAITGMSDGTLTFGGTQTGGDFARGTTNGTGTTTGGIFNNTASDMLWIQPGGSDFTPGTITARYQNNTGTTITSIDVSYDIHCLNDQGRSNSFNFSWSTDDISYNPEAALDYSSVAAATGSTDIAPRSITIGALSIPNGAFFYIRWSSDDLAGAGSRDEFGLENLNLTGNAVVACSGPPSTITSAINFPSISGTSLGLNWTVGDGTSRIVVMKEGSAITATPTNFTTYTASSVFGSGTDLGGGQYVVYNGSGNSATVTGLNPLTTYHVAIYEYNCSPGSEEYLLTLTTNIGNETTNNNAPTTFLLGDIVIIGVNANNNPCSGIGGEDLISFVSFVDITPGTSMDITDNGWERLNANQFGDTEGAYNMTYTGVSTIPAGTVFTLSFPNTGVVDADIANPDWSISALAGSNTLNMNNGGDQIFIMQGGVWADGGGTHDATYTGGVYLFAFNTKTVWAADGTTTQSNLHPDVACASILPTGGATDYIYYNGPMTIANANVWFNRIGNNANWLAEVSCSNYNSNFNITSIPIDNSSTLVCTWVGSVSTDWFDCQNWNIGRVPNASIDVVIPPSALNNCEIDRTSPFAGNFGNIATCRNMTVNDETLRLMSGNDELHINGNLRLLSGTTILDMDEAGADGTIFIHGNWSNEADANAFQQGEGTIQFVGNTDQNVSTLDGAGLEQFYNVVVNKPAGLLNNSCTQFFVENNMNFMSGLVITSPALELRFGVNATATNASSVSYVEGPCSKETSNAASTSFTFPIGKGGILAQLGISTNTFEGERFVAEYFAAVHFDSYNFNASEINHVSQIEYWDLDDVLNLGTSTNVTLHWGPHSDVVSLPGMRVGHYYTEAPSLSDQWESEGNTGTTGNLTMGTITSNPLSTYSPFTIVDIFNNGSLPLDLIEFTASKNEKMSVLDWTVDNEEPNTIYCMERSADGANFETISTLAGLGTPSTILKYNYVDQNPLIGVNYYRLRIQESGDIRYSPIRTLTFEGPAINISIYPSPAQNQLTVELGALPLQDVNLEVFDVLGQKVIDQVADKVQKHHINTSQLSPGTYILQVKIGLSTTIRKKFVKQ